MLAFLYYCLKVIICSGVLYGYYLLALRNNRFHQWNRWYLLAATSLSFALPIIQIAVPYFFNTNQFLAYGTEIVSAPKLFSEEKQPIGLNFSLDKILATVYLSISAFFLFTLLKKVVQITRLKTKYRAEEIKSIRFYQTREPGTPFSFFNNIFWNSKIDLHSQKGQQIFLHELTHVQQCHSLDIIFFELMMALAFWNPFLNLARKEISTIHEFIADQKASGSDDNLQYASLLLIKAMGSEKYVLGNPFFHSQLKRRITMLTTNQKTKFSYFRRIIALPLLFILLVVFSFQCQKPTKDTNALSKEIIDLQKNASVSQNPLVIIDGNESTLDAVREMASDKIESTEVFKGDVAVEKYGEKGKNGVIIITTKKQGGDNVIATKADQPASFPGGRDGWIKYLSKQLKYPDAAVENSTQGTVRVEMVVEKDGSIYQAKALNDPGDGLAEEAVRVVTQGPKWQPAMYNSQPIAYKFVQTLTFQLQ